MVHKIHKLILGLAALAMMAALVACEDEESALGIDLVDSSTMFDGAQYTLYPNAAWSKTEDSLLTSNYSFGIIGNFEDPVFGKTQAVVYTQIALADNTSSINFSEVTIDSVVMTFTKHQLYPDTAGSYNLRFEVKQLADPLESDKRYYSSDAIAVDESTLFFDDVVTVSYTDTVVRLVLDPSINRLLADSASAEEFVAHTRGLRIRVAEGSDNGMMGIDFSSAQTCITAYYHYDSILGQHPFYMGANTAHFVQFIHDYSGSPLNGTDSIDGTNRLYLEPMGGHCIHLNFGRDLMKFYQEHPTAAVHHAELRLPLAAESSSLVPDQVLALYKDAADSLIYIPDLTDIYTMSGFDGHYNSDGGYFRLRVTRHIQSLLRREGIDHGMVLLLDSRRHTANSAIINGISDTATSPKIVFVYSE